MKSLKHRFRQYLRGSNGAGSSMPVLTGREDKAKKGLLRSVAMLCKPDLPGQCAWSCDTNYSLLFLLVKEGTCVLSLWNDSLPQSLGSPPATDTVRHFLTWGRALLKACANKGKA